MSDRLTRHPLPFLHELGLFARIGVGAFVLVILAGMISSALVVHQHYAKRDNRAALSLTDLKGAYHGGKADSAMLSALTSGHPETLRADKREALVQWLRGENIAAGYDNIDLGERAPSEIMLSSCLECHARSKAAAHPAAAKIPLETWVDLEKISLPVSMSPTDPARLLLSTHAHSIALASMGIVVVLLLWMTRWPSALTGLLTGAMGLGLAVDLASWWLARDRAFFVYGIVIGGGIFSAAVGISGLLILVELVRPRVKP